MKYSPDEALWAMALLASAAPRPPYKIVHPLRDQRLTRRDLPLS